MTEQQAPWPEPLLKMIAEAHSPEVRYRSGDVFLHEAVVEAVRGLSRAGGAALRAIPVGLCRRRGRWAGRNCLLAEMTHERAPSFMRQSSTFAATNDNALSRRSLEGASYQM